MPCKALHPVLPTIASVSPLVSLVTPIEASPSPPGRGLVLWKMKESCKELCNVVGGGLHENRGGCHSKCDAAKCRATMGTPTWQPSPPVTSSSGMHQHCPGWSCIRLSVGLLMSLPPLPPALESCVQFVEPSATTRPARQGLQKKTGNSTTTSHCSRPRTDDPCAPALDSGYHCCPLSHDSIYLCSDFCEALILSDDRSFNSQPFFQWLAMITRPDPNVFVQKGQEIDIHQSSQHQSSIASRL